MSNEPAPPSLPPLRFGYLTPHRVRAAGVFLNYCFFGVRLAPVRNRLAVAEELEAYYEAGHRRPGELKAAVEAGRAAAAAVIGATDPRSVFFAPSVTDALEIAIHTLAAGGEIVTTNREYPTVYQVLARARSRGIGVRVVHLPMSCDPETTALRVAQAVGPRTTAVLLSHVLFDSGRIAPVARVAAACRASNPRIRILVDGAQGPGNIVVDFQALDCDAYATNGYKWLCAPKGTGFIVARGAVAPELATAFASRHLAVAPGAPLAVSMRAELETLGLEGGRMSAGRTNPTVPALAVLASAVELMAEHPAHLVASGNRYLRRLFLRALRDSGAPLAPSTEPLSEAGADSGIALLEMPAHLAVSAVRRLELEHGIVAEAMTGHRWHGAGTGTPAGIRFNFHSAFITPSDAESAAARVAEVLHDER